VAEEKYAVIVKINLPPEADYHSGHSLILQGNNAADVAGQIEGIINLPDSSVGKTILKRFVERGLFDAVKESMAAEKAGGVVSEPAPTVEAELASPALIKAAARKTGKTPEELGALTKDEATALVKGAK
jgi:hypothetical protein